MSTLRANVFGFATFLLCLIVLSVAGKPAAAKDVTGLNVRLVDYGPGAFVQTGPKKWSEVNKTTWKDEFHFDETSRSSISLKLHDPSRKVQIAINLVTGSIFYAPDGKPLTPLYTVASISSQSLIPGSAIAWDNPSSGDSASSDQTDAADDNSGTTADCSQFGTIHTIDGGGKATVTFMNDTDGYRSVMWLDEDGQAKPYKNLEAGESYVQQTYADSPWMITDGPGDCTEIYVPEAGSSTFHITAEANGDGGE